MTLQSHAVFVVYDAGIMAELQGARQDRVQLTLLPGVSTSSAPNALSRIRLSVLMVSGIVRISL